jgi:DNA-directed RNA polymerase beta' subunit
MGAYARISPTNAIAVSPLVVKPFNMDFDGDQANIHVPVSDDAVEEIRSKMLPSQNLFSLKDRRIHYQPSQEFVLGLYNSTRPNLKKKTAVFPSAQAAREAYKKRQIDLDTPVVIQEVQQ